MAWDHSCIGLKEGKPQSVLATHKLPAVSLLEVATGNLPPGFQDKIGNFQFVVDNRNIFIFSVFFSTTIVTVL